MSTTIGAARDRRLTPREIATIRAALRLWQTLRHDEIPEDALAVAHGELDGRPAGLILDDGEIERLLGDLAFGGDVVLVAPIPPGIVDDVIATVSARREARRI